MGENPVIHASVQAKGEFISAGITGLVELLPDGTVIKSPRPSEERSSRDTETEAKIYQLLGPHDRLVPMLGHSAEGLRLEYMENGTVKDYLREHEDVSLEQRQRWVREAIEGLDLLHSHGIIHCDFKPRNFLLDASLSLKIADFSGSSYDGSKSYCCEGTRYYLPRDWRKPSTMKSDLFALGSSIFEILTGTSPYHELPSDEVERLYEEENFPDVTKLPFGEVIMNCWLCRYSSAKEVNELILKS